MENQPDGPVGAASARHSPAADAIIPGMALVLIPDPSLVLLIGAAGAGKTTFASRHFRPDEVLSSDALRAAISGDESNQAVSRLAFAVLFRELDRRLTAGRLTVVDATNASRSHRAALLRRAARTRTPAVALVLALPAPIVLARNAARARRVDEEIVRRQLAGVTASLAPAGLATEGFATVWVGRSVEAVDGVTFERVPVATAQG